MNILIDSAVAMPDVQSSVDTRHIAIQRVGVRGVRHPMTIAQADGSAQATVANWELEQYRQTPMTPALFCAMAQDMLPLLNAQKGDIAATFPYFLSKAAPVSGVSSLLDYEVKWSARAQRGASEFALSVLVPVTSLCPCSKAISKYGAHNQRSHVTVEVTYQDPAQADVDALIRNIEQQASCELWGLLKRSDEKYVTERAYENPKFVEDLVRDVAEHLQGLAGVDSFRVTAENFESIHNHSAYAVIEG
jgi:GTP cyclohydrolase I